MTRAFFRAAVVAAACLPAGNASAQTSYPMIMSVRPVAAQVGQTSEHTVKSRYDMFGAYKVIVTGEGVTGEPVLPVVKEGEKPPTLTSLKVNFTVAPDAEPGVRDFRIATPRGVSTVGQIVIVRDPVVAETAKNDTADQAQEVAIPSTVCGAIEKGEDVDYFRFRADAGAALTFHVRSMRLQDRIHDLQQHVDPIITLRNAGGSTLATSDNHFYADPCLNWTFETAGDYLLEVRDVRYQGNQYWEYSIEIHSRPFVRTIHPLAVVKGQDIAVEPVGFNVDTHAPATVRVPDEKQPGFESIVIPVADEASDPVPVVVTENPASLETDADNNLPGTAQSIDVPGGVNGRISSEADVDCYRFEAKKGERYSFEVIARRRRSGLDSVLRVLNADGGPLTENDDLRTYKHTFADSLVENWTVPADGAYVLEVRDLHLRGGPEFAYFLKATRAEPFFELYLDTDKTQVAQGGSAVLFVNVVRKNGFTGQVDLQIDGLPDGVTASCGRIQADKGRDGAIILTAAADASLDVSNITITGSAEHPVEGGDPVRLSAVAVPYQETYQPGGGRGHWPVETHTVAVTAPADIRAVTLGSYDVSLRPGESKRIDVEIVRADGFTANVQLDPQFRHLGGVYANTLPPGVTVDSKNSKTLLTAKESKGHITLTAAADVKPVDKQQVSVMANVSLNFVMKATYSSEPLRVTVLPAE